MATTADAEANRGPQLAAIIWILVSAAGVFLGLRIYCKFRKGRGLWWDDYVLILSWITFLLPVISTTVFIPLGFGRHVYTLDPANRPKFLFLVNANSSLSILAAVWGKTSFAITLLRITDGKLKVFVWFIIVSMNLLMIMQALVPWVMCRPTAKAWHPTMDGECWGPWAGVDYGVAASAYSGVMDIVLALLPWKIIWPMRMRRAEKFGVALAMSMGIFAGCTAFIKTNKILLLETADFTWYGCGLVVWASAEVSTTIMAASIPVLRTLIRRPRPPDLRLEEIQPSLIGDEQQLYRAGLGPEQLPPNESSEASVTPTPKSAA